MSRQKNQNKSDAHIPEPRESISNQASQAKLNLIREKTLELEKIKEMNAMSNGLVLLFGDVADSMKDLSKGAEGVSKIMENWDYVFRIMSMVNPEANPSTPNPTVVKIPSHPVSS
ncbi:hypothetical protein J3Q64DRAFT_1768112 [Phycomyces blakesleeanus]|uniref:DASH complex subunit DAD2 n=2 Tax=Phycomyces blakesleeanus TaxID=4837 RepID=A0A167JF02_PHYB8|nr:hypothetical protein PHYBLDRAFT_175827 [Phycomyces blakesleeanus NRRL 1555(-)]OAD65866.1 hypothetical protein PHYBLDRAFT_175827 [Phycomyces blakesleeanus NRRL 1555(-)]|eukprot:XP_018283906.1 hypothetical protein PHYBLDRAFT_175827 [Phycomyces blakesleeanus NRRL 1555(-)]